MKKSMYLIAALAVAGFALTSCDKQNNNELSGMKSEVQFGLSVVGDQSARQNGPQYAPAESVYFNNSNTVGIKDIYVVPAVNEAFQKPVKLNDITANFFKSQTATTLAVNVETNRWLVYANIGGNTDLASAFNPENTFDGNAVFAVTSSTAGVNDTEFKNPHGVYLFADGKEENGNLKVSLGSAAGDWVNITSWVDFVDITMDLGSATYNRVKISNVTYAVGSLATAVYHGDYTDKVVYVGENDTQTPINAEWINTNVELSGIIIANQASSFNYLMEPQYGEKVTVYEPMTGAKGKVFGDNTAKNTMTFANAAQNANTFVAVAPSEMNEQILVHLVCKNLNESGIKFDLSKESFASGSYFYVPALLDPAVFTNKTNGTVGMIFEKGYTTLFNATVTNWEKAIAEPAVYTDVEVGIEVDLTWKEGYTINEEI